MLQPGNEHAALFNGELADVVSALCAASDGPLSPTRGAAEPLPSPQEVEQVVSELRSVLFPGYFGARQLTTENLGYHVGWTLDRTLRRLLNQVRRGLCFAVREPERYAQCSADAAGLTRSFMRTLPRIRALLASDAQAAYLGDPACTSLDEPVFCYPSLYALTCHRLAHELYQLGIPLIPRIINEHAHSVTGIDIHPGHVLARAFSLTMVPAS